MVTVLKPGQMLRSTRVVMSLVKSTALVLSSGLMDQLISENFIIIIFTVRECIPGQTIASTKESGEQTRCMEKVHSHGLTTEGTLENMQMTKREAMVNSYGLMVGATGVSGLMANSMEREPMSRALARRSTENGKKESVLDG